MEQVTGDIKIIKLEKKNKWDNTKGHASSFRL